MCHRRIIIAVLVLSGLFVAAPLHRVDAGPATARYAVATVDVNWLDSQRGRAVPARIYYPTAVGKRFPVILFSPGLGHSRDDCAYLGLHWAACGYVSVHVQHPGSDEAAKRGLRPRKELQEAFYDADNIRNRPLDLIFAIDRLEAMVRQAKGDSPIFAGAKIGTVPSPGNLMDLTRIGASGHDFGAQTVLALAGQVLPGRIAFAEPRLRAIVAMSAPVPLGQVPLSLAYDGVSLPCLHITGTADNSIVATTTAPQRRVPFDRISGVDQYLITLNGADHLTYSGHTRSRNSAGDAMFHQLIAECSAVFWDAYLKDDRQAKEWLAGLGMANHVGAAGRVEKKLAQ
jgi:predicted dienelactone hydrolase